MNHEEIKILISAYYDGEATAEEKAAVESHLTECGECRKYAQGLRQLSSTLKNWPDEALSPDVAQKINHAMQKSREGKNMYSIHIRRISISVATVVIVMFLGIYTNQTFLQRQFQGRVRGDMTVSRAGVESEDLKQTQQNEPYYLSSSFKVKRDEKISAAATAVSKENMQVAAPPQSAPTRSRGSGGFQSTGYGASYGLMDGIGAVAREDDWGQRRPSYPSIYYPQPVPSATNEQYDYINENQFLDAVSSPLSTFSIDVDTASYSNVRRFLNQNQLPPKDAVRIEEMLNYFTYDYPQPGWGKPFSITTEVSTCPWNPKHELVLVGIQGKTLQNRKLPPSNLVFLVDVSGSMAQPNKLPLVKQGFKMLAENLGPQDRVSIVVYAGAAGVVLDSARGNDKYSIMSALDRLQAGGSTAGGQGIQLAYQIAQRNFIRNGNNRVILATDGDFNVGVSNDTDLVRLIEEKRGQGVFLTVLGFGVGNYKDGKMEKLADKGNGNYAYIDTVQEAKKVMVNELGSMLFTIAKDVKIQVEFNPSEVKSYRLIGYENRVMAKEDFNDDTKDAGELGAGHTVTALYEIVPAKSFDFLAQPKVDPLKYQTSQVKKSSDLMTVKLRYKEPDSDHSQLITNEVNRRWMQWGSVSDNFQFASAVAEFGLLLRKSPHKGNASYANILNRASAAVGNDPHGYRQEFMGLVQTAQRLDYQNGYYDNPDEPIYPSYPCGNNARCYQEAPQPQIQFKNQ